MERLYQWVRKSLSVEATDITKSWHRPERRDLFFDKMYHTIKYKLFLSSREDPDMQLEMEIDFDIFNNYISTIGTAS